MTSIMSTPLRYNIKEKPEEFYVKELIDLPLIEDGKYFYYLLRKRSLNTLDAIKILNRMFNLKEIGYCGNKDKNAITEQYISINKRIKDFKEENLNLEFVGRGDKRLNLGDNKGNYFKIKIKNFRGEINKFDFIENYFDEQRFSKQNHLVGKYLIKKEFKKACELLDLEVKTDYVNALKKLNKKELLIYLHAYQSYLFNKHLSEYLKDYPNFKVDYSLGDFVFLKKRIKNFKIPLASFDTEEKIYDQLLKEEGICLNDFAIKQFPELVNETTYRDAFADIQNLKIKDNEIEFELSKGSYATIVIKKLFSPAKKTS